MRSQQEARLIANRAAKKFFHIQSELPSLRDAVHNARDLNRCDVGESYESEFQWACHIPGRIDYVLASWGLWLDSARIVYSKSNWTDLHPTSDHPGLVADYRFTPPSVPMNSDSIVSDQERE